MVIVIARGSAIDRVARTGAPARLLTDEPGVPPELHERLVELGVTSLVAAPIVVSGEIWGALVVSSRATAARAGHRGAARSSSRASSRSRSRTRRLGGARDAGRGAGRAQPCRRRGRDAGAARPPLQRRLGGGRTAVRRRRRGDRALCPRSGRSVIVGAGRSEHFAVRRRPAPV